MGTTKPPLAGRQEMRLTAAPATVAWSDGQILVDPRATVERVSLVVRRPRTMLSHGQEADNFTWSVFAIAR
jgi:hypothetical protein